MTRTEKTFEKVDVMCLDKLSDRELLIAIKKQLDKQDLESYKADFLVPISFGAGLVTTGLVNLGGDFSWHSVISGNNIGFILVGVLLIIFSKNIASSRDRKAKTSEH